MIRKMHKNAVIFIVINVVIFIVINVVIFIVIIQFLIGWFDILF